MYAAHAAATQSASLMYEAHAAVTQSASLMYEAPAAATQSASLMYEAPAAAMQSASLMYAAHAAIMPARLMCAAYAAGRISVAVCGADTEPPALRQSPQGGRGKGKTYFASSFCMSFVPASRKIPVFLAASSSYVSAPQPICAVLSYSR